MFYDLFQNEYLHALLKRYTRPKLAKPPTINMPNNIAEKCFKLSKVCWPLVPSLLKIISKIFPKANGTHMVMAEDITRQPMAARSHKIHKYSLIIN